MFGTAEDGLHDRLTDFSRPVGGAYYFAPSLTAWRSCAIVPRMGEALSTAENPG
jgi:deferrochelatase/peroxidase EfeB